jgi:hypothetical protein
MINAASADVFSMKQSKTKRSKQISVLSGRSAVDWEEWMV